MAYGARLESVLGESPRGFESPILRVAFSGEFIRFSVGPKSFEEVFATHSGARHAF